jgi:hypothetical protein
LNCLVIATKKSINRLEDAKWKVGGLVQEKTPGLLWKGALQKEFRALLTY